MLFSDLSSPQIGLAPPQKQKARDKDPRFRSESFRQAVRRVLVDIGEEPNYGNFRKYDGLIDWEVYANNLDHPTRTALCNILDGQGQKVMVDGIPVHVAEDIPVCSEIEAAELLAKESKAFVKWW